MKLDGLVIPDSLKNNTAYVKLTTTKISDLEIGDITEVLDALSEINDTTLPFMKYLVGLLEAKIMGRSPIGLVPAYQPFVVDTNADAYVDLNASIVAYLADTQREGSGFTADDLEGWVVEFLSCYQDSGGNLNFFVGIGPTGSEAVVQAKYTVTTNVITDLQQYGWKFPLYDPQTATSVISVKWSGAVGPGNDKVCLQLHKPGFK